MNKRHLHHVWTKLRFLRPWYFLVLAVVMGIVSVFALRANNQQMIELRSAVYAADESAGDVQGALVDLQQYVTAHMNTQIDAGPNPIYPPIQLKFTYDRLIQARAEQINQNNAAIYRDAQSTCEQQNAAFLGRDRIPCIEQYVQSQGITLPPISDALYKFDFVSPSWSPDLAGWSMVIAALSLMAFVVLAAIRRFSRS